MRRVLDNFRWGLDGRRGTMVVDHGRVVARTPMRPPAGGAPDAPHQGSVQGLGPVPDGARTDLRGAWLLPAFIDAHCHILPTGLDLQKLHLGSCATPEDVLDSVRMRLAQTAPEEWLLAVHYDQTRFPSGEHLTRAQLDSISDKVPILLRHVNGHASVANSEALRRAGVDPRTPDPSGGTYVRDESGELTGVLLERAHEHVSGAKPMPSLEEMVEAILAAGRSMRMHGITCAADMMTGQWDLARELEAYRIASERGCPIRLRLYLQWSTVLGPRALPRHRLVEQTDAMDASRCRVAGIKIFADGAIGSATAAIYGRFLTSTGDGEIDGQMIYRPERLQGMVAKAHEAGYGVSIHSIGDRSTDHVLDAFEAVDEPSRHRIEHAMILSDAQIGRMARLGIHAAMQPEFLHRLGHAYRRQLGPDRASMLKRARSVLDAGIRLSLNSDRPIVAGDPWTGIRTASSRPEGFDPSENLTVAEAIGAYTVGGADACGDPDLGGLEEGQWADFAVLDTDPLKLNEGAEAPSVLACEMGGEPMQAAGGG